MSKLLIALCLTVAAEASVAQSFAPWEGRGVPREMASAAAARMAPTGFAPWRDRETGIDMPSVAGSQVSDAYGSAFRPWS